MTLQLLALSSGLLQFNHGVSKVSPDQDRFAGVMA